MKILLLILFLLPNLKVWAETPIEIYADGHQYGSLQTYKDSQEKTASNPELSNDLQDDYMQAQARALGLKVDLKKVKTVDIADLLSEASVHQLYLLGVENGMACALENSYNPSQVPLTISSDQMQEAIKQAVTVSSAPKLLIAASGKLRIMTLEAQNSFS